jgi:hypothetical protein
VSYGLQHVEDDGPVPCRFCGRPAAGPCASCGALVCGDCCTLTKSSAKVWAVCLDCDRKGGASLGGKWGGLMLWLGGILAVLLGAVALLAWLSG